MKTTDTGTMKICTTEDLKRLARRAEALHLNRQIEVPEDIDPDGVHVLGMVLYGHNMDAGGHGSLLHHRTRLYMKVRDSMDPVEAFLDVLDDDWRMLQSAPEVGPGAPAPRDKAVRP